MELPTPLVMPRDGARVLEDVKYFRYSVVGNNKLVVLQVSFFQYL